MMLESELLEWLSAHMVRLGPGVLFVACLLETAVFAGLVLPVGALIAFASMLAARGLFDPAEVVAAAFTGALIGDQLGFIVGRWFISAARPPRGNIAKVWRRALLGAEHLVRERGLLGVSAARTIPFVRTIMPWFAGRSGMVWWRFLLFDFMGVMLWASVYVGGGFAAGAGWHHVSARFGEAAGAVVLTAAVLAVLALSRRWIRDLLRRRSAGPG